MTKELLEYRIAGILKEFLRFKQEIHPDLYNDLPQITDLIRDMMLYDHKYNDRFDQIWEIIDNYYTDAEI